MRKVLAGILIFDVVMGILCLVVGTRQYAGDRQLNTREGKFRNYGKHWQEMSTVRKNLLRRLP